MFESASDELEDSLQASVISAHAFFGSDHDLGGEDLAEDDTVHMAPQISKSQSCIGELGRVEHSFDAREEGCSDEVCSEVSEGNVQKRVEVCFGGGIFGAPTSLCSRLEVIVVVATMLLHRRPGDALCRSRSWWHQLIRASEDCDERSTVARRRRTQRVGNDVEVRAAKAEPLV